MYRDLLLSLCISTVLAAPQKDSNITYIIRQDDVIHQAEVRQSSRESRIEELPIEVANNDQKELEPSNEPYKEPPLYNYSDRIYSIKTKNKKNKKENLEYLVPQTEATIINLDIISAETLRSDLITTRVDNSTDKLNIIQTDVTENSAIVTEQYELEPTLHTDTQINTETMRDPFVTFPPKLSYYGKSNLKSFAQNLIAVSGKRRFRSRCKCEKIWNCAKLQISVARCPDEYFLCCG